MEVSQTPKLDAVEIVSSISNEQSDSFNEMTSPNSKQRKKLQWYYAPAFLLFWLVLFFAVVVPIFFHLPRGITIYNEKSNPGEFIAERAELILLDFDRIGPKVVGSVANEITTIQFLHAEIEKIRRVMLEDVFDLEVDVQVVSGAYMHWSMVNMYQGVQNFVVKLSPKNSTNESYLLLNSHFDTKPGSPGAGDDGAMLVVMLEILRVLATTRQTFDHPIVFLFNGAEENPLQASHGFITQHKWAKNCKALINLDSAGSGHQEVLFQSGPNHPWLMDYYNKHVKRPYATTMGEELFQSGIIPSDTDFRIFRDYGHVPGLDMAHSYNGYVYHTKFDKFNVIPRGTLQFTGDNILALTRAFANASELDDTSKYAEGHTIFYDFLGLFLVYYTDTVSQILNNCVAVAMILAVVVSVWRMAANCFLTLGQVTKSFILIFLLQLLAYVLSILLPLLMALIFDSADLSMTYFTHKWLVLGLYICPALFGLSAPTLLLLSLGRNDKLTHAFKLQMVLHSQSIILSIALIVNSALGIRTSYLIMITLSFYLASLILNMITTLHGRGYFWTILLLASQIMPFLYFSYLTHLLLCTLIPMMGRFGSSTNPDFFIAGLCACGTLLAMGFLIPLLNLFYRPKLLLLSLLIITFIFSMIAISPIGFPYRPETHVGRQNFLAVRRVFYEYDSTVSRNESGYYFDFQDRRRHHSMEATVDLTGMRNLHEDCEEQMMCGVPLFNHRWNKARWEGMWLPAKEPLEMPGTPKLDLLSKTVNASSNSVRYEFELTGPPHMGLFVQPVEGATINEWSFITNLLDNPQTFQPPYHIYFSYGKDNTPLKFHFDFKKPDGQFNEPVFELGVSAHYVSSEHERSQAAQDFINSFPDYIFVMEWPSSYERYIF